MNNLFPISVAHAGVISDAPSITAILLNAFNFLLSIVAIIAILALVVAGILYLSAAGDEKRLALAKRASLSGVVGIVIAFGTWIIVNGLVSFFE